MSPARARTRTARSGVKRTNHEATVPIPHTNIYVAVIRTKRRKNKFIRSKLDVFAAMIYYIQSYLRVNESYSVQKVLEYF